LYGEQVHTSAPSHGRSTEACAVAWTPSTHSTAPTACTRSAICLTGGRVPIRLDAAVIATNRVRSDNTSSTAASGTSPVTGSNSTHRTAAPTASAACTQGRMLLSWSSRDTTTSSPGPHLLANARDKS